MRADAVRRGLLHRGSGVLLPRGRPPRGVVAVDVAQVAGGVDDVADAALELLGLGEAAVGLAVPEQVGARGAVGGGSPGVEAGGARGGRDGGRGDDELYPEHAARRRLQGYFAQGRGEGG